MDNYSSLNLPLNILKEKIEMHSALRLLCPMMGVASIYLGVALYNEQSQYAPRPIAVDQLPQVSARILSDGGTKSDLYEVYHHLVDIRTTANKAPSALETILNHEVDNDNSEVRKYLAEAVTAEVEYFFWKDEGTKTFSYSLLIIGLLGIGVGIRSHGLYKENSKDLAAITRS